MHIFNNILGKITGVLIPSESIEGFYPVSSTCQIPQLSRYYEKYFGKIYDGCFVEVGAYDGEYASNTSGLGDIGWTGYYIEPVPSYYQACVERHQKNKNISVSRHAIGKEEGEIEIFLGGPLSTSNRHMMNNFISLPWAKGYFGGDSIVANQTTLDDYLSSQSIKVNFELLVIDVEGSEWDVLQLFPIRKWLPQMVIIELHDQNDDYLLFQEEACEIARYFDEKKYQIVYKDLSNTIYVPKESSR